MGENSITNVIDSGKSINLSVDWVDSSNKDTVVLGIPCQENLKAWWDGRSEYIPVDVKMWNESMNHYGLTKTNKTKEEDPMKTLYNIIVVTKQEEIILDAKVVAEDTEEAKFLVGVAETLKEKGLKPRDVTIICNSFGEVKIEKEPQKVQLVKE